MYLPATTMAIARTTDKIITNDLINFEIFLLEVLANQFNIKYITTKITSVIKKKIHVNSNYENTTTFKKIRNKILS